MNRPLRIVAVTLGLIIAGAVFGAIAGALALAISLTVMGAQMFALTFAAVVGGALGAVTAPVLGWLLLRHAPLGQMFVGAVGGTVVGGVVGWFVVLSSYGIDGALYGAFIGCLVSTLVLRRRAVIRASPE